MIPPQATADLNTEFAPIKGSRVCRATRKNRAKFTEKLSKSIASIRAENSPKNANFQAFEKHN